jgi:hypothetical protein
MSPDFLGGNYTETVRAVVALLSPFFIQETSWIFTNYMSS